MHGARVKKSLDMFKVVQLPSKLDQIQDIHQQPEVNYLPRFGPHLISLERLMLSIYCAGEIDPFENLDIFPIRLLVDGFGIFQPAVFCPR